MRYSLPLFQDSGLNPDTIYVPPIFCTPYVSSSKPPHCETRNNPVSLTYKSGIFPAICGHPDDFVALWREGSSGVTLAFQGRFVNGKALFSGRTPFSTVNSSNLFDNVLVPAQNVFPSPYNVCFSSMDDFNAFYLDYSPQSYSSLLLPAVILASLFFIFIYKMLKRVLF